MRVLRATSKTATRPWWFIVFLLAASLSFGQSSDIFRQIYVGDPRTVVQLVESDPYYVHARESGTQRTPLMAATETGRIGLVEYFIARGADINAVDSSGNSATRWAAMKGFKEIAKLLLDKGARPDMFAAAMVGDTNLVVQLLKQDARWVDPKSKDIAKPIVLASRANHLEVMKLLLDAGASAAELDLKGQALFHEVARRGANDQINLLLDHKVDVNLRTTKKETALHLAAQYAGIDTVKLLLDRGADPNLGDWREWSALHAAVFGNKPDVVAVLLEKKVDVNKETEDGAPLHLAIWKHGNPEIVRQLLEHDADYRAKNRQMKTSLKLAREYRRPAVIELLTKHGALE